MKVKFHNSDQSYHMVVFAGCTDIILLKHEQIPTRTQEKFLLFTVISWRLVTSSFVGDEELRFSRLHWWHLAFHIQFRVEFFSCCKKMTQAGKCVHFVVWCRISSHSVRIMLLVLVTCVQIAQRVLLHMQCVVWFVHYTNTLLLDKVLC